MNQRKSNWDLQFNLARCSVQAQFLQGGVSMYNSEANVMVDINTVLSMVYGTHWPCKTVRESGRFAAWKKGMQTRAASRKYASCPELLHL
jgi:hypothetical protein